MKRECPLTSPNANGNGTLSMISRPIRYFSNHHRLDSLIINLIKSFYVAKKKRKDIIYTLPTQSDVNDMAGGKINRIVAQNPILKESGERPRHGGTKTGGE